MKEELRREFIQTRWWNTHRMSFFDKLMFVSMRYMALFVLLITLYSTSTKIIYPIILELNDNGYFDGIKSFVITALTIETPHGSLANSTVVTLLFTGFSLYILKRKQQFYYGLLETIFALANCQIASDLIKSSLLKGTNKSYILLVTGITTLYLLIRGLSNIREGYDKPFFLKSKIWPFDLFLIDYRDIRKKYDIKPKE